MNFVPFLSQLSGRSLGHHRLVRPLYTGVALGCKDSSKKEGNEVEKKIPTVILKEVPEAKIHWEYTQSSATAKVYDRKPIKILCKEGKVYMWCACGQSKQQPFCDGTHRHHQLKITLRPLPWKCLETGNYWFCNCKRTGKKPFCDGKHKEIPETEHTTIKH